MYIVWPHTLQNKHYSPLHLQFQIKASAASALKKTIKNTSLISQSYTLAFAPPQQIRKAHVKIKPPHSPEASIIIAREKHSRVREKKPLDTHCTHVLSRGNANISIRILYYTSRNVAQLA